MGIRKIIYGILQLGAESTATTQATAVIQSTSGSLALVPSGSGALTAAIPDGTTVGGNARGNYAVDLQRIRSAANRVADGDFSVIVGGQSNGMNGLCTDSFIGGGKNNFMDYFTQRCVIVGGENNNLSNNTNHSFIGGGLANSISVGDYATIPGGGSNAASSNYSTISGGQSNTASTNTHATVVGGQSNTSSGAHSISGGNGNTASGQWAISLGYQSIANQLMSISLGREAYAIGTNSIAIGGNNPAAIGASSIAIGEGSRGQTQYSVALGALTTSHLYNQFTTLGTGIGQASDLKSYKQDTLTTGATSSLSLDGTGTTNLIIPSGANRAWNTTVNWVATVTGSSGTTTGVTVGNSIYGVSEFGFKVSASIASITPLIRDSIVADTAIMETATLTYATGSSNSLAMTFTAPTFAGSGSLGMRVVAKVSLVELAW